MSEDDAIPGSAGSTDAGDAAGDTNVSFLIAGSDELLDLTGYKIPVEVGYYQSVKSKTAAANDNITLSIVDLRAGLVCKEGMGSVNVELAMNDGQDNNAGSKVDFKGSLLRLSAEVNSKDKGLGLHAQMISASGDDQADNEDKSFHDINGDVRFGEILSNDNTFTAVAGLTGGSLDTGSQGPGLNILSFGGHYVIPAMDKKVTAHADYVIAKTSKSVGTSKNIGNELDLALNYAHNDNVSLKAGYAMLSPDDALTSGGSDDAISKLFAKLTVKWGSEN
jgi:hypothetical protein